MALRSSVSRFDAARPLSSLEAGAAGVVARVIRDSAARAERLTALGVTPGARIRVLQTFPGIVFLCDETEIAVERTVARAILVDLGR
jgi:DtxR family Mn-dependent transcriptional regulator